LIALTTLATLVVVPLARRTPEPVDQGAQSPQSAGEHSPATSRANR